MYVETDFYGSGNVLRLRQAYGSYGGLLAGQTWSTFVDDEQLPQHDRLRVADGLPVDPAGAGALDAEAGRQGVVVGGGRGQQVVDHDTRRAYPARPSTRCRTWPRASASRARAGTPSPRGFLGQARFRPTEGEPDDVTLWGGILSGRLKTFGKRLRLRAVHLRRRRRPLPRRRDRRARRERRAAAPSGSPRSWAATSTSGRRRYSSNVVYSVASAPDEDFYPDTFNKRPRLRRRQSPLLVPAEPRVGRRRVSATAAARSSVARTAPPIGFSSRFASTSRSRDEITAMQRSMPLF